MQFIRYLLRVKYLALAWLLLFTILISLGCWVYKEMENEQEFQGAFSVIPEPIVEEEQTEKKQKTIERLGTEKKLLSIEKVFFDKDSQEKIFSEKASSVKSFPQEEFPREEKVSQDKTKIEKEHPENSINTLENSKKGETKKETPSLLLVAPSAQEKFTLTAGKSMNTESSAFPYVMYSRSFNRQDPSPKIVIVITGLGQSVETTVKAIESLPPEVTLCFIPYARNVAALMNQSRAFGHENLIMLPMEPESYPRRDPGPYTLLTGAEVQKNLQKLEVVLAKGAKFVGVTDFMGSRFVTSEKDLNPIFKTLKEKGLIFLDNTASLKKKTKKVAEELGLPYAKVTRSLDPATSLISIDDQLKEIEKIARSQGYIILYAFMYPKVIDSIQQWSKSLKGKGFVLAPLTAIYNLPLISQEQANG